MEKVIELHFQINTKLQFWKNTNTPHGNKSPHFIFLPAVAFGALILEISFKIPFHLLISFCWCNGILEYWRWLWFEKIINTEQNAIWFINFNSRDIMVSPSLFLFKYKLFGSLGIKTCSSHGHFLLSVQITIRRAGLHRFSAGKCFWFENI